MLTSYATGVIIIVLLAAGWVAVQRAWGAVFGRVCRDPDVLVGRGDCHGCTFGCRKADLAAIDGAAEDEP